MSALEVEKENYSTLNFRRAKGENSTFPSDSSYANSGAFGRGRWRHTEEQKGRIRGRADAKETRAIIECLARK